MSTENKDLIRRPRSSEEYDLKNGSNLIVLDEQDKILVVREKTRKQLWMLPGGAIERGEAPAHAAQSETEEETGIIVDASYFSLIGFFVQRPKGIVFLYETRKFEGDIYIPSDSKEVSEARFMSFEEIIKIGEDEFRTAYLRMLLCWKRCQLGLNNIPYEGRLSDKVELPGNIVLSI